MFEKQILNAHDFIRRIHLCAEKGLDAVPKSDWISGVEQGAWYAATEELISHSFGVSSREMQRYRATFKHLNKLLEKAHARGDPKWDFTYWIEHYHQMIGLLQEFDAKVVARQLEKQQIIKETVMGDKYVMGQVVGSVGPGSQAHGITVNQIWNQVEGSIPLDQLGTELALLRQAMKKEATDPEQDVAIGAVAAAERASNSGNGPEALKFLRTAGKWGLDVAEKIGVGVATAAIKSVVGL